MLTQQVNQMKMTKWLERLFLGTTLMSVVGFLLAFFVLPMGRAQANLASLKIPVGGYVSVLCLATAVMSVLSFFLYRITQEVGRKESDGITFGSSTTKKASRSLLFEVLKAGVSVILLFSAISQINAPLDIDEAGLWSLFPSHTLAQALDPNEAPAFNYTGIPDKHHSLSILASYLSYRVFGMSKTALRMPAIFFSALFLILLAYLTHYYLTRFEAALLYANLCCNQMAQWYFHSSRGYISMMLATLVPFAIVWSFARHPNDAQAKPPFSRWLFLLSTAIVPFTHTFGGGFLVVLAITLIVWLFFNRKTLSPNYLWKGCLICFALIVVTPIVGLIFLHHGQVLTTHHYIFGKPPELWSVLSGVLGANRHWWGKLTLLLVAGILWYRAIVTKDLKRDFLSLFVFIYILFFASLIWAMNASYINPRFFLAFLIPFLIWLAQSIEGLPLGKNRVLVTLLAVLLLVVAPLWQGREVTQSIVGYEIEFNDFVAEVLKITAPNEANCYRITGDGREATWAKNIFFLNLPKDEGSNSCLNRYHLTFLETISLDESRDQVVYTDHKGRYLLRVGKEPRFTKR